MIIDSAKYTCAAGHDVNEDSCLCSAQKGIFIVADGLGGHADGEKASMTAVDYLEENCTGGYTEERVCELMENANTEVSVNGGGGKSTVAAAFVENGRFIYANVGDSRVYYFRNGKIIAQTKDHSVCQASVDVGMLRPEDIRGNEDRSRLLKVLGSEERLNIKKRYQPIGIQSGDAFLICSDGFWEYVYENEMEADLLKSESSEAWLKYMLKRHILRAENKGDNYTAICGVIYLDGTEEFEDAESGVSDAAPSSPKKKNLILPIAAAFAVIAAAICVFFWLTSKEEQSSSDPQSSAAPVTTSAESAGASDTASVISGSSEDSSSDVSEKSSSDVKSEYGGEDDGSASESEYSEEPSEPSYSFGSAEENSPENIDGD